ncbi:MAG: ABC transporter substrate-binding protein [Gemmatimonadota bacterium]
MLSYPRSLTRPAAWLVLALLSVSGCGPAPSDAGGAGLSATDPTGRAVTLDAPARRVVSLVPGVTEWLVAMGAADRLVARTDYDRQPALEALPSVGGGLTPSIEWLAARRPDLVIAWPDAPSRAIIGRLEQLGVAVYAAPVESVAGALAVAADLGTLLGAEAAARSAIAEVRDGLDSVRAATRDRAAPDVLFLIGLDPLMAAGPGTFVDELLTAAGARNVLEDLDILWPQLSVEAVVRRAPDVVIVGSVEDDPNALLGDRPGWRQVPAVRRGAVHAVEPDLVNRTGPGMDEAAALLARLIHSSPLQASI